MCLSSRISSIISLRDSGLSWDALCWWQKDYLFEQRLTPSGALRFWRHLQMPRVTYLLTYLVECVIFRIVEWLPQGQHCSKIMKPPQCLPLQMAERLLRAQPNSVANHVTARSISDCRALTWLDTETGWDRRKRSAICSGKLISVYMIWYGVNAVNRRHDI